MRDNPYAHGYRDGARDALAFIRGVIEGFIIEEKSDNADDLAKRIKAASIRWADRQGVNVIGHS